MITVSLTNEMLNHILNIERCRTSFAGKRIPAPVSAKLRKNSKKRSTYASNRIEGNPLTEEQRGLFTTSLLLFIHSKTAMDAQPAL